MGAPAWPASLLTKPPGYVPPWSQTVSPGLIAAAGASAVARSHGLAMLPSPWGEPVGDTWKPGGAMPGPSQTGGFGEPPWPPAPLELAAPPWPPVEAVPPLPPHAASTREQANQRKERGFIGW